LPRGNNAGCAPVNEAACNFNRQNWAALLKLRPLAPLPTPSALPSAAPGSTNCCINCVVGAIPVVPRCRVEQPVIIPPGG
jgi:hypothetical protein